MDLTAVIGSERVTGDLADPVAGPSAVVFLESIAPDELLANLDGRLEGLVGRIPEAVWPAMVRLLVGLLPYAREELKALQTQVLEGARTILRIEKEGSSTPRAGAGAGPRGFAAFDAVPQLVLADEEFPRDPLASLAVLLAGPMTPLVAWALPLLKRDADELLAAPVGEGPWVLGRDLPEARVWRAAAVAVLQKATAQQTAVLEAYRAVTPGNEEARVRRAVMLALLEGGGAPPAAAGLDVRMAAVSF